MNVRKFNATGDGVTDDRPAIQSALDAAALLGDGVYFPPGTYIVGRSGTNAWCLDMPGDNLTLHGVKGASWIKAAPIKADSRTGREVTPAAVLRINARSNITLSGLGIDGNWGNALTEIAAASNGIELPTDTINVKSTAGFPEAGTIQVMTSVVLTQTVHYARVTSTSFMGCTGGAGTMFRGGVVGRLDWGNAQTEITAASNGVELPTGTINVKSTTGFRAAGTIKVMIRGGLTQTVHYTEVTPTSFTGCTGGTGTMFKDDKVIRFDTETGINHSTQVDPKNYGIQIRGSTKVLIDNCLIQQTYGDGIWLGHSQADRNVWTQDVRITNTNVNIAARDGIAFGRACGGIYIGHTNFTNIFSQAVDSEPVDQPVRDVVVEHCHLGGWWNPGHPDPGNPRDPGRAVNAPLSIVGGKYLTGSQTVWARKFRVRDCTIDGACVIESAVDVVLERNRIVTDFDGNSYAPVLVSFFCDDIWVLDNEIYDRTADASAGRHAASITVMVDGSGETTMQPSGVTVRGNRIHARRGRHGIQIVGTGARARAHSASSPDDKLLPDEANRATTVTATTLARAGAEWADDQWQGRFVRIGKATAGIASNTADTLTLYVPGEPREVPESQKTAWYTPLGAPVVTPAAGAYEIYGIGGVVDIDGNDIDCTDDGNGAGGIGIRLWAARAGMRVRCRNNKIKNAGRDAINVQSVDEHRPFLDLVIANNHAWDDQLKPTCTAAVRFTSPRHIDRLVLCGNSVEGKIAPVEGLDSGVWLVEEGLPERWAGRVDPNSNIAARIGAIYQQLAPGGASVLWVKQGDDGQKTGWVSTESRGVNVRMFGAKGDGSTDDREAIQKAIDAVRAAGGGVVFFPAGHYVVGKIDPPETSKTSFYINGFPDPLVFEGVGAASIIRMKPGPTPAGDSAMFRVDASANVSFHHLCLHGHRSDIIPPRSHVHCILIDQVVDVTVHNVEFRGPVHNGIKISGAPDFKSRRLMIAENLFIDCTVSLDSTQGVQFVSNSILRGVVVCTDIQDFVISNNTIVRGVLEDKVAALNLLGEARHGAVTGNIIRAEHMPGARGIRVLSRTVKFPEKIRLSQNTIQCIDTGINMNGQDISVSDNVIEGNPGGPNEVGINVEINAGVLGDAIQVRNNHIRNFHCAIKANGDNAQGGGGPHPFGGSRQPDTGRKPRPPHQGGDSDRPSGPSSYGAWEPGFC